MCARAKRTAAVVAQEPVRKKYRALRRWEDLRQAFSQLDPVHGHWPGQNTAGAAHFAGNVRDHGFVSGAQWRGPAARGEIYILLSSHIPHMRAGRAGHHDRKTPIEMPFRRRRNAQRTTQCRSMNLARG